jgi:hypothetical protein
MDDTENVGLQMETPRIKPNEHENRRSQVQVQQHFAAKLVPFVDPTDARKSVLGWASGFALVWVHGACAPILVTL